MKICDMCGTKGHHESPVQSVKIDIVGPESRFEVPPEYDLCDACRKKLRIDLFEFLRQHELKVRS